MAVRNVEYIISLRDNFSKQLAGINKNLQVTGRRIQSIGKTMSLAVTLPIVALGGTAVKLASDFEETESKFNTVFSSIREQANNTAKNLKDNFGLSSRAAFELLGNTGDLLVGFGFTESAALEMSQQVNELAVDLASFTNVQGGAQSASAALTKALLGERESVKTLGISILESDVKARVLLNTQKGMRFESERQAKAVATLMIATEQSSKAIGDFERTSQSFANQMRITRARLEDLGVQIGKILLPIAQKLLQTVKGWIKSFSQLSPETKKTIVVIAGLVAILGPLLLILGTLMATVIPGLITAFGSLNAVMLLNPVLLIVAGVVALTAALIVFDRRVTPAISKTKLLNDANIQAFKSITAERFELQRLIRIAKEETLSKNQRRKAIEKINAISPKFLGNITLEEINTKKTSDAVKEYTKSILLKSRAQAASNRIVELEGKVLDLAGKKALDLADFKIPQFSTLNPMDWRKEWKSEAVKDLGMPELHMGNAEETNEASSKMVAFTFEQPVADEQEELEQQIFQQLNIKGKLVPPLSIDDSVSEDEAKDGNATKNTEKSDTGTGSTKKETKNPSNSGVKKKL
ncbi:hypothetical protein LCGC14_1178690 [marine sediment metagenome]|uniref:Phage tail tape measure protein domain-containing protein n=1 Tax=marine sediment metagenome TaxID=412755 RepID=A0A0F9PTA6_9ZZZZ